MGVINVQALCQPYIRSSMPCLMILEVQITTQVKRVWLCKTTLKLLRIQLLRYRMQKYYRLIL